MKAKLNRLRRWAGVDRPVFFAGLGQAWSLFSGPITIFLITRYFTPQTQGYYYTFSGVMGLSVFLELGFSQCIIQFASHEFAYLRFGPAGTLEGDAQARSRLISLGRLSLKWYGVISLLAVIILGMGGSWFFWAKHDPSVSWILPWWGLCLATGLSLFLLPVASLLEGCDQVAFVYGLRTVSRIITAVVLWLSVWGGANLFAGSVTVLTTVLVMAAAYLWRWHALWAELRQIPDGEKISWRREIWPLQWRIAVSWVSSYFIYNFFTPVLFYFHGPVVAGQMGATMTLVNSLSTLSAAWTVSKAPRFGLLIKKRQFRELDSLFFKATTQAVCICIMGGTALIAGLVFVRAHFAMGTRFLAPGPTSLLVMATVVNQVVFSQAAYLQAHKQAPFLTLSLVNGVTTGLLVVGLGRFFGAWGVAWGYALVQAAMLIWACTIWNRCRKQWHKSDIIESVGGTNQLP